VEQLGLVRTQIHKEIIYASLHLLFFSYLNHLNISLVFLFFYLFICLLVYACFLSLSSVPLPRGQPPCHIVESLHFTSTLA
jgi:uncharacterized membrane protein YagU involved in acid resistance